MSLMDDFNLCSGLLISLVSLLQVKGGIIPLGEITPVDPILRVGENLTLTCNLTNYFGHLDSSSLYFVTGRTKTDHSLIPSQFYSVVSLTAIRLTIPVVKHEDQNFYKCFMNDTHQTYVTSMYVRIGSPPDVITELEVVSRNLQDLSVTWCTRNIKEDLVAYNLSWTTTNWGIMESCPHMTNTSSQCYTCLWHNNFEGTHHLVIRGLSIYGNSTSNFTINATEHVKPNPVSSLVIEPLNSTFVKAKWKRPPNLTDLLHLNYTLTLMRKPFSPLKTVVVEESDSIVLGDFHPGAIYTFSIRCIPGFGGILSDETTTDFKMLDDVPAAAPEFPLGWFHSPWCMQEASVLCSRNSTCLSVTFYWLPIPGNLRNGEILGYRLQYKDSNGNLSTVEVNSTSAEVLLLLHRDHVLHLSAFTSAGPSVIRSIAFQSNCNGASKQREWDLFAEQILEKNQVIIEWKRVEDATSYSLLYCRGKDKSCLGEPMLKVISPDQKNLTLLNVTEHIFALAVNTERGTRGLFWICLFDYDGSAPAPKFISVENGESETELVVKWLPVTCNDLPRPGRVLHYTVTYAVTGTNKEKSLQVHGNETRCSIHDLIVGANYTIAVRGNTRKGPGETGTVFHVLNPTNTGVSTEVLLWVGIPCAVIVLLIVVILVRKCLRWTKIKFCWLPITIPSIFDGRQSSQLESQENKNCTSSANGYAVVSTDPNQEFLVYDSETESILMSDFNHNESSFIKAKDCSYQSVKSSNLRTPTVELKGNTDIEALLCNSSETADSVDSDYHSGETGYASANMASQMVLHGPPKSNNCDSSINESSGSPSFDLEQGSVERELKDNFKEDLYDSKRVIQAESRSPTSIKTDEHSVSGDYSRASYVI